MLKVGKLTDYGTLLMATLAGQPQARLSAHELAQRCGLAQPTVGKLLRQLARSGLVHAERGVHGGYRLARPPESISVAEVVAALEGPISLTECTGDHSRCRIERRCGVRGSWRLINATVNRALTAVSLAQLAAPAQAVGDAALTPRPLPPRAALSTIHR